MTIHYDLLGTHPELDDVQVQEAVTHLGLAMASHSSAVKDFADRLLNIIKHHYGLLLEDFNSLGALLDAVESVEQANAVR